MTTPVVTAKGALLGRELTVKLPDVAQLGLLQHQARVLQKSDLTDEEGVRALSLSFRVLFSFFPDKDDLHYVEDLIADGDLDIGTLTHFVVETTKESVTEQEEKPRVRRGRPRKAA